MSACISACMYSCIYIVLLPVLHIYLNIYLQYCMYSCVYIALSLVYLYMYLYTPCTYRIITRIAYLLVIFLYFVLLNYMSTCISVGVYCIYYMSTYICTVCITYITCIGTYLLCITRVWPIYYTSTYCIAHLLCYDLRSIHLCSTNVSVVNFPCCISIKYIPLSICYTFAMHLLCICCVFDIY